MDEGNSDRASTHAMSYPPLSPLLFERIAPVKNGIGCYGESRMDPHLVRVTFCKCGG
jgi:hypothetical protein